MMKNDEPIIIDGENMILGRLASLSAKKALEERDVIIVNSEKVIISGSKRTVLKDVKRKLKTRTLGALEKSPVHYRRPDKYLRRVIRGMLPWKKQKGREAYKRIKVYIGVPPEFINKKFEIIDTRINLKCLWLRLEDLTDEIGGFRVQ